MVIVDIRNAQNLQSFVDRLVKLGYKWGSEHVIYLEDFEKKECIYIDALGKVITYSSYYYAKNVGERTYMCKTITLSEYMESFSKEDLKPGMVVEYKNGERRLVVEINGELWFISGNMYADLHNFNNDLTCSTNQFVSVVAVYETEPSSLSTMLQTTDLIWKKPKETVLTMQEIADKFGIPVEQLKIKK